MRAGTAFFAAAFFSGKAGVEVAGFFAPVDLFTGFEATALAALPWVAGEFFAADGIACTNGAPVAEATEAFAATFFPMAFTGAAAATVGAAAPGDGFAATDAFTGLPFADAADLTRLDAIDFFATFFAGDGATGARGPDVGAGAGSGAGAGAALIAKLSSVRPAAMPLRSQAGRGPRPPHWLPFPSLNLAPLAAGPFLPFVALVIFEAEGGTADAAFDANFRSPAVRLYFEIMSLIFAIAPLASTANCFWADAWRAAISRASCA